MGSGTTALAALKAKRRYIGYDVEQEYIKLAEERLKPYKTQFQIDFGSKI